MSKSYVSYKIQLPGWVDLIPRALIIGLYWPIGPLTAEVSTSKVVKAMTHQYPTRQDLWTGFFHLPEIDRLI